MSIGKTTVGAGVPPLRDCLISADDVIISFSLGEAGAPIGSGREVHGECCSAGNDRPIASTTLAATFPFNRHPRPLKNYETASEWRDLAVDTRPADQHRRTPIKTKPC